MMKRNILRAAVAASILGVSGAAFAESVDVPFSGTVTGTAGISTPPPSEPVIIVPNGTILSSHPSQGGGLTLVGVTCIGQCDLSIAPPNQVNGPMTSSPGVSWIYGDENGTIELTTSEGSPHTIYTNTDCYVGMEVDMVGLPPGTYRFIVTLTLTPK